MHLRLRVVFSTVALLALISGSAAELSPQQLKDARKIYLTKCAKCHELYDPKAYSDADWNSWMLKMKKKSKLKDEQFDILKTYTETLRASPAPTKK